MKTNLFTDHRYFKYHQSELDFSDNPEDEDYVFKSCVFEGVTITLAAPHVRFIGCSFIGEVIIINKGSGSFDTLEINGISSAGNPAKIFISSLDIIIKDFKTLYTELTVKGNTVSLEEMAIIEKMEVVFHEGLTIKKCELANTELGLSKYSENPEIMITDSVINGREVSYSEELPSVQKSR